MSKTAILDPDADGNRLYWVDFFLCVISIT